MSPFAGFERQRFSDHREEGPHVEQVLHVLTTTVAHSQTRDICALANRCGRDG